MGTKLRQPVRARARAHGALPPPSTHLPSELQRGGLVVDARGALKHLHHGAVSVHLQDLPTSHAAIAQPQVHNLGILGLLQGVQQGGIVGLAHSRAPAAVLCGRQQSRTKRAGDGARATQCHLLMRLPHRAQSWSTYAYSHLDGVHHHQRARNASNGPVFCRCESRKQA